MSSTLSISDLQLKLRISSSFYIIHSAIYYINASSLTAKNIAQTILDDYATTRKAG